jgi:cytochrome P450
VSALDARGPLPASALLDRAAIDDAPAFYRRLRTEGPVWHVPGVDLVVVSSFEAIHEAIGRPEDFSSNLAALIYRDDAGNPALTPFGDETTNVLAVADPPVHGVHRGAVFPELVNRRMRELRPEIDALAQDRLDEALRDERVEFMGAVADAIPIRVISTLIGWEDERPDELLAAAFASTEMLGATRSRAEIEAAAGRTAAVAGWIAEQLTAALAAPGPGLLGVVARAIQAGDLDFTAGLVILHTLLSAGGESTTGLLGNATHVLATRPDLQERLRTEPGLLTPFVEEVLRLHPPFGFHMRHARRPTELQGTPVPAGSVLLLMWGGANRDPVEYDQPDEVVLDRPSPRHHMGFGRGIHHCVGAPLARLEADVVLSRLLQRTSSIRLDPDAPPQREDSLMIRRFARLPLLVGPAPA